MSCRQFKICPLFSENLNFEILQSLSFSAVIYVVSMFNEYKLISHFIYFCLFSSLRHAAVIVSKIFRSIFYVHHPANRIHDRRKSKCISYRSGLPVKWPRGLCMIPSFEFEHDRRFRKKKKAFFSDFWAIFLINQNSLFYKKSSNFEMDVHILLPWIWCNQEYSNMTKY